ncbi:TetR/AcrR family transcriptional regulator, partial [Klebsiella sp. ME-303]
LADEILDVCRSRILNQDTPAK